MSHSPDSSEDSAQPSPEERGRANATFGKMLGQGRSFSGHERNCSYLNTGASPRGGGRFANISAVTGVDFPDDGRGLAILDWDHDGDLDLWFSNRNAPRLRLLRNDTPPGRNWLALRLAGDGTSCNRDAIGARVEVVLGEREGEGEGGKESRPLIKSLRAGEGFVAQSSKWVSFGLGKHETIEKVVVRWPAAGAPVQEFTGLEVNRRYRLTKGKEEAEPVAPRTVTPKLTPSRPEILPPSNAARIPVVTLIKPPRLEFRDERGRTVKTGAGRPVLVMLWASWCAPCVAELTEIRERAAEIRGAGLAVVALSVDGLGEEGSNPAEARAMLKRMRFPFLNANTNQEATRKILADLQTYHDRVLPTDRPLPVPSSFLIDGDGNLAVIYRGRLSVDALLSDLNHTKGTLFERWVRAAPLPGRTIRHENAMKSLRAVEAGVYYQHASREYGTKGGTDTALHYLQEVLRFDPESDHVHQTLGEIHLLRGNLQLAEKFYREAVRLKPGIAINHEGLANVHSRLGRADLALPAFDRAISLDPNRADPYRQRAAVHEALGNLDLAVADCDKAIELQPEGADTFFIRGQLHKQLGNHQLALRDLEHSVKLKADNVWAVGSLAWHLATCADPNIRDGRRAVAIATRACELSQWKHYGALDALAAAYAENNQFEEAIRSEARAIELAPAAARPELQARLTLYRARKPYREPHR